MQDKFEEFVKSSRKELDVLEPREELWNKIEKKLNEQKPLNKLRVYYVAASLVFLMLLSFVALTLTRNVQSDSVSQSENIMPGQEEAEMYYAALIEIKRNELGHLKNNDPDLYKEFDRQLENMQSIYNQLKNEMKVSPDKELVLKAMIENLQIQLQVLNQQLEITNEVKHKKQSGNENRSI